MPSSLSASGTACRTRIGWPSLVEPFPRAATYSVPEGDVDHHSRHHFAVDFGGDRDGVARQPVEEVHGAVDRIHDPADARRAADVVALLPQECVVGPAAEDELAEKPLAGTVGLGNDVRGRRLGGGDLQRPPPPLAHQLSGCPGRVERNVPQAPYSSGAPHSAGRSPRGLGQQPTGHRSGRYPSDPTVARSTVSPRSTAARSRSRSRTTVTNRWSMPAVAARTYGRPSSAAVAAASVSRS